MSSVSEKDWQSVDWSESDTDTETIVSTPSCSASEDEVSDSEESASAVEPSAPKAQMKMCSGGSPISPDSASPEEDRALEEVFKVLNYVFLSLVFTACGVLCFVLFIQGPLERFTMKRATIVETMNTAMTISGVSLLLLMFGIAE
jgi:hypothetical protein